MSPKAERVLQALTMSLMAICLFIDDARLRRIEAELALREAALRLDDVAKTLGD